MGKVLLWLVAGYVAFVLLASTLFAAPPLLLLLLAVVLLLRRGGRGVVFAGRLGTARPALEAPAGAEGERPLRRLRSAAERLASAFPDDSLDSPAHVAVLAPYAHEPEEERVRVERDLDAWRGRFAAWRRSVAELGNGSEVPHGELRALVDELAALDAHVAELERRATEADELPQTALDEATRAGTLIDRARAALAEPTDLPGASAAVRRLDEAAAKHAEAWAALGEPARPLTALRLARKAAELAESAGAEGDRLAALPDRVTARTRELEAELDRARERLAGAEEAVRGAAASYAPSSWHEVRGAGGAAREAVERAARVLRSVGEDVRSGDRARLESADHALGEAAEALEAAARLRERIERHLGRLETAALEARDRVVAAEKEIDGAWSATPSPADDRRLERAAELVERARAGLEESQPDWLAIVEFADRATQLARGAGTGVVPGPAAEAAGRTLEQARDRAHEAHETATAWAIVAAEDAARAQPLLDEADRAFRTAVELDAGRASSNADTAAARQGVAVAYSTAEEASLAFVAAMQARRGGGPAADPSGPLGHALVWDVAIRLARRA